MTDKKENVKFLTIGTRYCENCRDRVKHEIGQLPDGTGVKCCMRCDALTRT